MNKESYLDNPDVAAFIEWLAQKLESDELSHKWTDRRTNKEVRFTSLFDAFLQYKWNFSVTINSKLCKGASFEESHKILIIIERGLRAAFEAKDPAKLLEWCLAVLRWGGVFPRNGKWLENIRQGYAIS